MVASAFIVTFLIGPRLRKQKALTLPVTKSRLTLEELLLFDGNEGRLAYFAYQGKIYEAESEPSNNTTDCKRDVTKKILSQILGKPVGTGHPSSNHTK